LLRVLNFFGRNLFDRLNKWFVFFPKQVSTVEVISEVVVCKDSQPLVHIERQFQKLEKRSRECMKWLTNVFKIVKCSSQKPVCPVVVSSRISDLGQIAEILNHVGHLTNSNEEKHSVFHVSQPLAISEKCLYSFKFKPLVHTKIGLVRIDRKDLPQGRQIVNRFGVWEDRAVQIEIFFRQIVFAEIIVETLYGRIVLLSIYIGVSIRSYFHERVEIILILRNNNISKRVMPRPRKGKRGQK